MTRNDDVAARFSTLAHVLQWRALHQPDQRAYTFLADGETQEACLTYGELDRRARAIAFRLAHENVAGQPILLLYPPGLQFIEAFFGALYAGAMAVPLYPPRRNRPDERLAAVIRDSGVRSLMTTREIYDEMPQYAEQTPELTRLQWIETDASDADRSAADAWTGRSWSAADIAFLQYTSGSTNTPKGVMVSHGNLMANQRLIRKSFGHTEASVMTGWLPLFHDMGLVGMTLQPLYVGGACVFMSPIFFLQRPIRWLRALSRYKATTSGGPNFAYDLCVSKTTPAEREGLDLSAWEVAYNGAEPVRADTLERFTSAFEPHGFRRASFFPCYGMAETTLLVAAGARSRRPVSLALDADAMALGAARAATHASATVFTSIGCGQVSRDEKIAIVDPETRAECPAGRVGEIWVSGESVAQGYWKRPVETEETFHARLKRRSAHFLRTGDLGFLSDNELYITGRLKDLIVIRGRNYYPQDIEKTVEASHPGVRYSCTAAVALQIDGEERLLIACEIERKYMRGDTAEIIKAVRRDVFLHHELRPHTVCLLKPGAILKTSSGKIRRTACKDGVANASLEVVAQWREAAQQETDVVAGPPVAPQPPAPVSAATISRSAREQAVRAQAIQAWVTARLVEHLKVGAAEIDVRKPFADYGLDSVMAVRLSGELEQWLGRRLPPTLLYDCPTVESLAVTLSAGSAQAPSAQPQASSAAEPVAIVGIGCRLPGADGVQAFWKLLRDGLDTITEVPAARWDVERYYDARSSIPGKMNTRWGGFLEHVDYFDAGFFGISPREARSMDPQQRTVLEVAHEAMQDAGIPAAKLSGTRTGVFIGICNNDYGALASSADVLDPRWTTGNAFSVAANRISYVFNLKGPSLAIDTACSSSLVAIHLACQSLWSGESAVALAGGVNLILRPDVTISFSAAGGTSPDGRCKAFDAGANGMVRSEGAGIVVLKPLSRALADGDTVYAVIRASAVNHDGQSNGITAPNQASQEAVLRDAYAKAGRSPGDVQYVEAHGTGTLLGDPVEAYALGTVLSENRAAHKPCAIGSVKANIGHTEAAAGVASLVKVALSLKHRTLPASPHYREPNPHIDFEALGLRVQGTAGEWPDRGGPRLAGVSAFGFGGTNAHVVLEQAPAATERKTDGARYRDVKLLPISARTPTALASLARSYLALVEDEERAPAPEDLCYTAGVRRDHYDCRLGLVFNSRDELIERLKAFASGELLAGMSVSEQGPGTPPKIAFVFSGHRGQRWQASAQFLQSEPVFAEVIAECSRLYAQYADWSLVERLTGADGSALDPNRLDVYHPCQFAYQVALAALWRSLGVEPAAVVGHSFGEVAAAHVAGALSLEDAVKVVFSRSRCLQHAAEAAGGHGAMAAVEMPRAELEAILEQYVSGVSIVVRNSPTSVVVSGSTPAVAALVEILKARQVFCNVLQAPGAGHSEQIDAAGLARALEGIAPRTAAIPIVSSVLGTTVDGRELDAAYWARNVKDAVLFADAIDHLIDSGCDTYIEIAPYPPVLSYAVSQCLRARNTSGRTLPHLRRNAGEALHVFGALAELYARGYPVRWERLHAAAARACVPLPPYPWQRERYWIEPSPLRATLRDAGSDHPLLGQPLNCAADSRAYIWETELDVESFPFIADHKVQGAIILPTTAYLEMALTAAHKVFGTTACVLENLVIRRGLFLSAHGARKLQLVFTQDTGHSASIQFFSRAQRTAHATPWILHASVVVRDDAPAEPSLSRFSPDRVATDYPDPISSDEHYRALAERGVEYGPAFRGVQALWSREAQTVGRIRLADAAGEGAYLVHPALLDACLQALAGALHEKNDAIAVRDLYLPVSVAKLTVHELPRPGASLWSRATLRSKLSADTQRVEGDVEVLDDAGRILIEITGFALERVGAGKASAYQDPDSWLYEVQWEAIARTQAAASSQHSSDWVIFADDVVGPALARELRRRGESCSVVVAGAGFARTDATDYRIDPSQARDYESLVEHLFAKAGGRALAIVHLWSLLTAEASGVEAIADGAHDRGCLSVLRLVHALSSNMPSPQAHASARLFLVTAASQALGTGTVSVAPSAVWGLGKVIAFEHPELGCALVDLPANPAGADALDLLEELRAESGTARQVALRRDGRFEARLRRLPLNAHAPVRTSDLQRLAAQALSHTDEPIALQADATYLVTGGLGGIGIRIAQWMVQRGARRLVLMGRTGASVAAGAAIQALEARGAQIHVARADVADPSQVAAVLAQIRESMPALRGVVHAAATVDPGLLRNLDGDRFKSVMAPKVNGAWNLHELTTGLPLDFFVMFSSAASLLGTPGQGNYVVANAYLDALAHHRRAAGLPALSINWGGWSEVGLLARHGGASDLFALRGFSSMTPEQGLDALEKLLRHDFAQVAVLPVDWTQLREAYPQLAGVPFFADVLDAGARAGKPPTAPTRAALLAAPADARHDRLCVYLCEQLARTLGVAAAEVDANRPINTMGIDSLMALEMKNRIETELGMAVPVVRFLEGATMSEIARVLVEGLGDGAAPPATGEDEHAGPAWTRSAHAAQLLIDIEKLSDDEVDSLLVALESSGEKA
jgi:acyl transferase domain-containing protein/acyl-CoA synthetase (AMP-forming)/AMP-acid ligase II/acyl carrier protein